MAVYDGLFSLLVEDGPLSVADHGGLYWARLPKDNGGKGVVVAAVLTPGTGPTYYLGSEEFPEPAGAGVTNDAGVLWLHAGVNFYARSRVGEELAGTDLLELVRDRMLRLREGGQVHPEDPLADPFATWEARTGRPAAPEVFYMCQLTSDVELLEQDTKGRLVHMLAMELWHYPLRRTSEMPPELYDIHWPVVGGIRWPGVGYIDWPGI